MRVWRLALGNDIRCGNFYIREIVVLKILSVWFNLIGNFRAYR